MNHRPDHAILTAWQATLDRCGERPALLSATGQVERSFAEIDAEARDLEPLLLGLPPHAVVAVQLGNDLSWPALLLALFRRRLVVALLGSHMESAERSAALGIVRAAVLIERQHGRLAVTPCAAGDPFTLWEGPPPDLLKLTSGTTSQPRAVRFRAGQLLADARRICAVMGIAEDDLNFGVIPFSHSYGFSNLLTPLLCAGVPLVASDDRMPRAILNHLAQSGATVFPGTPIFFQKLAELQNAAPLPALRLCISAGASLPQSVAAAFTGRFGLKVHSFYGSSECGGIAYDASPVPAKEEGWVGPAMAGVAVEWLDGVPGPIAVRSDAVGDGYFPEPDPAKLDRGRFVPGDSVAPSQDGLALHGRLSEVINIAGRKLNPLEVEARLSEIPGVNQVVVFGIPSVLRGEEAVACIAGEVDSPAVLRFCRSQLSAWQVPREVWVVPEIPTNERGKINRRALAECFLETRRQRKGFAA